MSERNRRLSTNFDDNSNDVSMILESKIQIKNSARRFDDATPMASTFAQPTAVLSE